MEGLAAPVGRTAAALAEALFSTGYDHEFYQAVALLHAMRPDAVPVAQGSDPAVEPVRFRSSIALGFPQGDVVAITPPPAPGEAATMTVAFMGLAGAHGPLPNVVTEIVLDRIARKDHAFRAFLDVFNHRLVSLQYRIRAENRPGLAHVPPPKSRVARYLFALSGMGTRRLQGRMGIDDRRLLGHAAVLAGPLRSQSGLAGLISEQFGIPATVEPFKGRWLTIPEEERTVLGRAGRNKRLGREAVAGSRVWDQQSKFVVVLGPLSLVEFLAFLPRNDTRFQPLVALTRFYAGGEFEFEFKLQLRRDEIPRATLSSHTGALLGWTSWVGGGRSALEDAGTIRLSPDQLEAKSAAA